MSYEKEKMQKPKYNILQNTAYMISSAWRFREKKVIFLSLSLVLLSVASNLVGLFLLPAVLSAVERGAAISAMLLTILGFVGATMLIRAATSYIGRNKTFGELTVRFHIVLQNTKKSATMSYQNFLSQDFLDKRKIANTATDGDSAAAQAIWDTLKDMAIAILCFLIYAAMMTAIEPVLLIVILITSLVSFFVSRYTTGYRDRHKEEWAVIMRRMSYSNYEVTDPSYAKDVRLYGLFPFIAELRDKATKALISFQKRQNNVAWLSTGAGLLASFLRNGIAYLYLIGMVLNDGMSIAEFSLYFGAVSRFSGHISGILQNFVKLRNQSSDISRLREFSEYPEPFKFEEGETLAPYLALPHTITLENVGFTYPSAEEPTLKNINLTLHPCEKLAIVGLNGAGKTTLINIICGFLDPTEGRVLFDGKDIRDYNRRDYYALFTAVFQYHFTLAGSLTLNIAQDPFHIDMERVRVCAIRAGIAEKIESLPNGYETKLERRVYRDATELSGGEKQKLLLARALYKDAPFLILDEPTAALDPVSEYEIYSKFNEIAGDKTAVYISHRLASCRFCDKIAVFDEGKIVQSGSHEALLADNGGKYAELWNAQAQYYIST